MRQPTKLIVGWLRKTIVALVAAMVASAPLLASPVAEREIEEGLASVRQAAIEGDARAAESVFAEDLVLVSQSGTVYGREAALFDISSGFVSWKNEDVVIRKNGAVATVTLINRRERANLDIGVARFRVMQIWRLRETGWQLTAQSSVKLHD